MTFFFVLLVIAALAAISMVAAGRIGRTSEPVVDRSPVDIPDAPVTAESLAAARFSVAFRGYRMEEVDALLAQVAQTLEGKEEQQQQP